MLRTPLGVVNRTPSGAVTSPLHAKDKTPFTARPKLARSPIGTDTLQWPGRDENAAEPPMLPPVVPLQTALDMEEVNAPTAQPSSILNSHDTTSVSQTAPRHPPASVIKVMPPTPMAFAPAIMTAHKASVSRCTAGIYIADTPLTTPSRRLAPQEFQEYIKHFRSPVDKFRKQSDRLISMQGTPMAVPVPIVPLSLLTLSAAVGLSSCVVSAPVGVSATPHRAATAMSVPSSMPKAAQVATIMEVDADVTNDDANPFLPARALVRSPHQPQQDDPPAPEESAMEGEPVLEKATANMEVQSSPVAIFTAPQQPLGEAGANAENKMDVQVIEKITPFAVITIDKVPTVEAAINVRNAIPTGNRLGRTPPAKVIEPIIPVEEQNATIEEIAAAKGQEKLEACMPPSPEQDVAQLMEECVAQVVKSCNTSAIVSDVPPVTPYRKVLVTMKDSDCNTSILLSTPGPAAVGAPNAETDAEMVLLKSKYEALHNAVDELEALLDARNQYCESLEEDYTDARECILDYECRIAKDAMKLTCLEADLRAQKVQNTFERIKALDADATSKEYQYAIVKLLSENEELQNHHASHAAIITPSRKSQSPQQLVTTGPNVSSTHRMSINSPIHPVSSVVNSNRNSISEIIAPSPEMVDHGGGDFGFDADDDDMQYFANNESQLMSAAQSVQAKRHNNDRIKSRESNGKSQKSIDNIESRESMSPEVSTDNSYQFDERCPAGYRIRGMRFIPLDAPKLHYLPIEPETGANVVHHKVEREKRPAGKAKKRRAEKEVVVEEGPHEEAQEDIQANTEAVEIKKVVMQPKMEKVGKKSDMHIVPLQATSKRKRTVTEPTIAAIESLVVLSPHSPVKEGKPIAAAMPRSEKVVISLLDASPSVDSPYFDPLPEHKQLLSNPAYAAFCNVTEPELKVLKNDLTSKERKALLAEMWSVCTPVEKQQWAQRPVVQQPEHIPSSKRQKVEKQQEESPIETVSSPVAVVEEMQAPVAAVEENGHEKDIAETAEPKISKKKSKKQKQKAAQLASTPSVSAVSASSATSKPGRKRKIVEDVSRLVVVEENVEEVEQLEEEKSMTIAEKPVESVIETPASRPAEKKRKAARKNENEEKENVEIAVIAPLYASVEIPAALSMENVRKKEMDSKIVPATFGGMSPITATPNETKDRVLRSGSKPGNRRMSTMSIASSAVTESFSHNQMRSNNSNASSIASRRIVVPKLKAKIKK